MHEGNSWPRSLLRIVLRAVFTHVGMIDGHHNYAGIHLIIECHNLVRVVV